MSDKDSKPGILKRIASNRDIKIGLIFLAVAVVFAFASITQDIQTSIDKEEIRYDGKENWYPLDRKYEERTAEIYLEYNATDDVNKSATIYFGRSENANEPETRDSVNLKPNESKTLNLKDNHDFVNSMWVNFPENSSTESGTIDIKLKVTYLTQPYSLLTFPAMVFTLAGVVFSLKGKSAVLAGIGEEKKEEKMMKEMKDEDEDEMARLERSRKEQGLQNRPESSRDDIKFMGVDFKGEEEEDEKK